MSVRAKRYADNPIFIPLNILGLVGGAQGVTGLCWGILILYSLHIPVAGS